MMYHLHWVFFFIISQLTLAISLTFHCYIDIRYLICKLLHEAICDAFFFLLNLFFWYFILSSDFIFKFHLHQLYVLLKDGLDFSFILTLM